MSTSARTRKPSAAAMKRERERVQQSTDRSGTPLAAAVEVTLASYTPRMDSEVWETIRPIVVEAISKYGPSSKDSAEKLLWCYSRYATWCFQHGVALTLFDLLNATNIEAFTATGLPDLNDQSRASVRSRLRRVAARLQAHPSFATPKAPLGHRSVAPPYTASEVRVILDVIRLQPPVAQAQLTVSVALGLGGGISSTDLGRLHKSHVLDHGSDGIEIHVPGKRARTVWMLPAYEELLREGLAKVKRTDHVMGRSEIAKNTLSDLYSEATATDSRVDIAQGRLRNTWLGHLMTQPVPLSVLLPAAGLLSARTLTELLPYVLADREDGTHSN